MDVISKMINTKIKKEINQGYINELVVHVPYDMSVVLLEISTFGYPTDKCFKTISTQYGLPGVG